MGFAMLPFICCAIVCAMIVVYCFRGGRFDPNGETGTNGGRWAWAATVAWCYVALQGWPYWTIYGVHVALPTVLLVTAFAGSTLSHGSYFRVGGWHENSNDWLRPFIERVLRIKRNAEEQFFDGKIKYRHNLWYDVTGMAIIGLLRGVSIFWPLQIWFAPLAIAALHPICYGIGRNIARSTDISSSEGIFGAAFAAAFCFFLTLN